MLTVDGRPLLGKPVTRFVCYRDAMKSFALQNFTDDR